MAGTRWTVGLAVLEVVVDCDAGREIPNAVGRWRLGERLVQTHLRNPSARAVARDQPEHCRVYEPSTMPIV